MISASLIVLAATVAQPNASSSGAPQPVSVKEADPVICERFKEVGSLLNSRKVCKHRSEWAEDRRNDRANIERSQRTGMKGE